VRCALAVAVPGFKFQSNERIPKIMSILNLTLLHASSSEGMATHHTHFGPSTPHNFLREFFEVPHSPHHFGPSFPHNFLFFLCGSFFFLKNIFSTFQILGYHSFPKLQATPQLKNFHFNSNFSLSLSLSLSLSYSFPTACKILQP
jgi:hypothetical protein